MNEKKKTNIFSKVMIILFLLFLICYILSISGYYENKMHLKTTFTEEKMNEFENDVKNGVEIDLNNYIDTSEKNYSNKFTKISDNLGNISCNIFEKGLAGVIEILKALFS